VKFEVPITTVTSSVLNDSIILVFNDYLMVINLDDARIILSRRFV